MASKNVLLGSGDVVAEQQRVNKTELILKMLADEKRKREEENKDQPDQMSIFDISEKKVE